MVSQKDLEEFLEGVTKFANDPTTDREFLAFKFLNALLGHWVPSKAEHATQLAFELADEFIRRRDEKLQSKKNAKG